MLVRVGRPDPATHFGVAHPVIRSLWRLMTSILSARAGQARWHLHCVVGDREAGVE